MYNINILHSVIEGPLPKALKGTYKIKELKMGAQRKWTKPGLNEETLKTKLEETRVKAKLRRVSSSYNLSAESLLEARLSNPIFIGLMALALLSVAVLSFLLAGKGLAIALYLGLVLTLVLLSLGGLAILWLMLLNESSTLAVASIVFPPLTYSVLVMRATDCLKPLIVHFLAGLLLLTLLSYSSDTQMLEIYKVLEMTTMDSTPADLIYLKESIELKQSNL